MSADQPRTEQYCTTTLEGSEYSEQQRKSHFTVSERVEGAAMIKNRVPLGLHRMTLLRIESGPRAKDDKFHVEYTFKIGPNSDGINPLTEVVSFTIGTFSTTIPIGSFKSNGNFQGRVDGVALNVTVVPLFGGFYSFTAEGEGANLTGTTYPVPVQLIVGNDQGSMAFTRPSDSQASIFGDNSQSWGRIGLSNVRSRSAFSLTSRPRTAGVSRPPSLRNAIKVRGRGLGA